MTAGTWSLEKDRLSYWLRQLRKERELIGPLRQGGGDIAFQTVEMLHEIATECPSSLPSPKEFLFPQYEPMLFLPEGAPRGRGPEDLSEEKRRVVFGVRSCDISALKLLDGFFLKGFEDPYYRKRRENTLFISLVCRDPDPACFCVGLGTGPYLKGGFDIQMTDIGRKYLIQAGGAEGLKAVLAAGAFLRRPSKADHEDAEEVYLSSKARFKKRISLDGVRRMILSGKIKDDFWQGVARRCFECGGCVYECPLCTCFTVTDRKSEEGVERARMWDSCLFKGFTRMAGGVLPEEERFLRTKRWFYHKLLYCPETLGAFGCVGCGRCAVTCPGNIDMASLAVRLEGLAIDGGGKYEEA